MLEKASYNSKPFQQHNYTTNKFIYKRYGLKINFKATRKTFKERS